VVNNPNSGNNNLHPGASGTGNTGKKERYFGMGNDQTPQNFGANGPGQAKQYPNYFNNKEFLLMQQKNGNQILAKPLIAEQMYKNKTSNCPGPQVVPKNTNTNIFTQMSLPQQHFTPPVQQIHRTIQGNPQHTQASAGNFPPVEYIQGHQMQQPIMSNEATVNYNIEAFKDANHMNLRPQNMDPVNTVPPNIQNNQGSYVRMRKDACDVTEIIKQNQRPDQISEKSDSNICNTDNENLYSKKCNLSKNSDRDLPFDPRGQLEISCSGKNPHKGSNEINPNNPILGNQRNKRISTPPSSSTKKKCDFISAKKSDNVTPANTVLENYQNQPQNSPIVINNTTYKDPSDYILNSAINPHVGPGAGQGQMFSPPHGQPINYSPYGFFFMSPQNMHYNNQYPVPNYGYPVQGPVNQQN
jgi:hypothetical protein